MKENQGTPLPIAAALRLMLDQVERSNEAEPPPLAEVRAQAECERQEALASEGWAAIMTGMPDIDPNGELTGLIPLPAMEGVDLFGKRLAFDLVGCCADQDQVTEKLNDFSSMIEDHEHFGLVALTALGIIVNFVVPYLLHVAESRAGDYNSRVMLATAARNVWAERVIGPSPAV